MIKRFFFTLSAILSVTLLGGLSGISSVKAASEYDNLFTVTDSTLVHDPTTSSSYFAYNNLNLLDEQDCQPAIQSIFTGNADTSYYYNVIRQEQSNGQIGVIIHYILKSEVNNPGWYFQSGDPIWAGLHKGDAGSNKIRQVVFGYDEESNPNASCGYNNNSFIVYYYNNEVNGYQDIVANNFPILNVSSGYVGGDIGNYYNIPEEIAFNESTPDWCPVISTDWDVTIADKNFFTTDNNLIFLCEDDLAPIIHTEIYLGDDASGQLIDTLTFSASAEYHFKANKVETEQDFHLRGKYDCGDSSALQFDQWGSTNFSIGKDGTLSKADHILNCFSDEFPYIHIGDCFSEINNFLAMLVFRVPDDEIIGKFSNLQTGCRELQVFDDWLHIENATVCPQFSSTIRNIITPFITFLLGLLTVTFIHKRQGIRGLN